MFASDLTKKINIASDSKKMRQSLAALGARRSMSLPTM